MNRAIKENKQIEYYDKKTGQNFSGLRGLINFLSDRYPYRVIEFGTQKGALSLCLAVLSVAKTFSVYTFDNVDECLYTEQLEQFKVHHHIGDIFKEENITKIKDVINIKGKTIVLCIGINKMDEFLTYAPALKEGDYILIHDHHTNEHWNRCLIDSDEILACCDKHGLVFQDDEPDLTNGGWGIYKKTIK